MNDKSFGLVRDFYTAYGYFQAQIDGNLTDGFIEFLAKAYDIFDRMGRVYRCEIYEIIYKCNQDEYHLKDDIDLVSIAEHIEYIFSTQTFD